MTNYIIQCSDINREPDIRELAKINGMSYPSDDELIMLMLGKGSRNNPIDHLATDVLNAINISNDSNLIENLKKIDGMGESRALAVAAALELGRRRNNHKKKTIECPRDIIPYVQSYTLQPTEHFIVVSLNGAKEILNIRVVSVGTLTKTLIHPREILAEPVMEHASAIICCHNHPGDHCAPSTADIKSTLILEEASAVLGIAMMDHLILTTNSYFSFLEHGLLKRRENLGA